MQCIVTAGPTYEELDKVRRLTNFSSGRLGSELANFLTAQGHEATLLLGHYSTWRGEQKAGHLQEFTTTEDLRRRLQELGSSQIGAVFHAAAVSDFCFGKIWTRSAHGELTEVKSAKFTTRGGTLLAELLPTPKVISELRTWFSKAYIVGWKFEVEGTQAEVLAKAERQVKENHTNACVANGRAYGHGFGLVTPPGQHRALADSTQLFAALEQLMADS